MKFLKYFFIGYVITAVVLLAIAGFRGPQMRKFTQPPIEIFPDMDHQPKFKAQSPSSFFADGRSDRAPVAGTVPFSIPLQGTYFGSGISNGKWGNGFPKEITVDEKLLARGKERFDINCMVCHGPAGYGNGVTSKLGLAGIANLHQDTFIKMEDGHIFYTIGHGKGNMGPYPHITIEDRWAIVAYIRALQKSSTGTLDELPDTMKSQLK